MSRPTTARMASTNLGGGASYRSLEGKVAIVTGGSRGIGAAISENLASKGCSLVLNYTSESSAEKTSTLASHLETTYSIKAISVQADMGSETGPAHLISVAKNNFSHPKTGKFQIDILINNAGVSKNMSIDEVTADEFAKQYNVNVRGPLLLVKAAEPFLPHDRSGRIINISSVSSSLGFHRQSIYGGTKAALEAMTRTWSRELSERCTVNSVNPGPVATDMYGATDPVFQEQMSWWTRNAPLARAREGVDREEFVRDAPKHGGRPAYDHEIAGVVGMLVGEESGWCTGSVVCANGGFRMSG
ncbi:MAG: putative secondary metabolism biosynthetic enzyme [Bogoriella megaspora]|nr:MAG: putative secondary metabolism biosynthetic enzyme [Bogoriella megaspora]